MTFGKKKSGFQGQKQWPPQFHIKFSNTGTPSLFRKYSYKIFFYCFSNADVANTYYYDVDAEDSYLDDNAE